MLFAMSVGLGVLMYGLWSSMFSLAKNALAFCPPIFLTGFRMWIGAFVLLLYLAIRDRASFKISGKQFLSLCLLGFFSVYLTNILEFWALLHLSSAKACFIYSLSPFFAAFFSYLYFDERMNGRKWLGLGVGLAGMIPVFMQQTGAEELLQAWSFFSWPTLAMVGAALFSVYGWILLRLMVKDNHISPAMANGTSMLFGGLLAFGHSWMVERWEPLPVLAGSWGPFLGWTCLMALVSNVICYNLYGLMLRKFTATFLSFLGLVSPFFASLHGWIMRGEPISWTICLSTLVVSLGLWIVYSAELKQGYIAKKA